MITNDASHCELIVQRRRSMLDISAFVNSEFGEFAAVPGPVSSVT